jgi:molecular chaperone DnaK
MDALSIIDLEAGGKALTKPVRVFGIDLGTTNSVIAEVHRDPAREAPLAATCIEVSQRTLEGNYVHVLVPSVVSLREGMSFVGEGAKRLRARADELGLRQNESVFYECKNDMGCRRTYHRAPEGYRSAPEIGAKVLSFLMQATTEHDSRLPGRTVISVPASFQASQRNDTLRAADLAGIRLEDGDLIDEPIAAFLDYLVSHGSALRGKFDQPRTLLVFDFGGGTCDVAVFRVRMPSGGDGGLQVESLSVSRYHRLGGGDIDAAIVHEVLIPQLQEQNGIGPRDLGFEQKKQILEPTLLGLAESLKVGLCIEIARLRSFGKYDDAARQSTTKTHPGVQACSLGGQELTLASPKLTAAQFEKLLEPFLDPDLLFVRETEYRMTCSIFAPLQDGLDRAGLEPSQVDFCLLVGGSSLIPQVGDAVRLFLKQAATLTYPDRDSVKTCVARGAALHAFALQTIGRGLVTPICHDEISIISASGPLRLITKGASLPYPAGRAFDESSALAVPQTSLKGCSLRLEIVAGRENRRLFTDTWQIPGPVAEGDPLLLQYRYDANQVLHLRVRMAAGSGRSDYEGVVENPLTNVVNPQSKRIEIDEMEESLRTGKVRADAIPANLSHLADLYGDLGQWEKAIALKKRALQSLASPDAGWLNRLAGFYGRIGDEVREEKCYLEATKVSPWTGTWFNLALSRRRRGQFSEAMRDIEKALEGEIDPAYLVLAGDIASRLGQQDRSRDLLKKGMALFGAVEGLDDFHLSWYETGARMSGDTRGEEAARRERIRRATGRTSKPEDVEGEPPMLRPALTVRGS